VADLLTAEELAAVEYCRRPHAITPNNGSAEQARNVAILAAAFVRLAPFLAAVGPVAEECRDSLDGFEDNADDESVWLTVRDDAYDGGLKLGQVRALVAAVPGE
jgi:hypothetical protein